VKPVVPEWAEDVGPHLAVVLWGWLMSYWGSRRDRMSGESAVKVKMFCSVACGLPDAWGFGLSWVGVVGQGGTLGGDAPGCALM
jgi:hypothetical protein